MRSRAVSTLMLVGMLWGAGQAAHGTSANYSFESAGNLLDFSLHPATGNTRPITWQASGGVGNSGSLLVDRIHETTYAAQSFEMTTAGDKIYLSTYFRTGILEPIGSGTFETYGEVYLTKVSNGFPFDADVAFVDIERDSTSDSLRGGPLQAGGGSFPGFTIDFPMNTLQSQRWYELNVTYENLGSSQIGWDIKVNDRGSNGLQSPVPIMSAVRQTSDTRGFLTDGSLYAGFSAVGFGVVTAIDNFSVSDEAPSTGGGTLSVIPTFDIQFTPGTPFTLTEGATTIRVGGHAGSTTTPVTEAILEFPLAQLPAGAVLESATLSFDPSISLGSPLLRVAAYAGDGLPSTADAQTVGTVVQNGHLYDSFGATQIALDTTILQPLVDGSTHLGLRIANLTPETYLTMYAREGAVAIIEAPTLVLEYSVGLAGDFNTDGTVDAADYTVWRDGYGSIYDLDDYQDWKSNFGQSSEGAGASSSQAIPEPACAALLLAIALAASVKPLRAGRTS